MWQLWGSVVAHTNNHYTLPPLRRYDLTKKKDKDKYKDKYNDKDKYWMAAMGVMSVAVMGISGCSHQ